MKKFHGYVVFFVVAIIAVVLIGVKYSQDPLQQMLKENRVLIDRVLAVCETTDGENREVDQSDHIILDGDKWIDNYQSIIFSQPGETKIDQMILDKIKQQLYPIRSDYNKFVDHYKDVIRKDPQSNNMLIDQWSEAFNILGSSLNNDLNDYRRKKKAMAMVMIKLYVNFEDLPRFLKNKIQADNA